MQFRTKILTFATMLALGAVVCATLTLLLARGIERGTASVTRAEDQLNLFLALEIDITDMLLLEVALAAAPTPRLAERVSLTEADVRRDLDAIRALVTEEGRIGGVEVADKLAQLDEIDTALDEIDAALAAMPPGAVNADRAQAFAPLLLDVMETLDTRLAPMVDLAIAEEVAQVIAARSAIAEMTQRSARLGVAAGALTLMAAVVGSVLLLMSFMRPFGALLEGASRLAQGDLGFRITEGGGDEMGRLSRDFNVMAAQLERSDRALRAEEQTLQRRVADRTAELEAANARLAAQDETRRRFLADVSHELRTPLTVMRGEAEVALRSRDTVLNDGAADALGAVVEQTEHMSRLVDDLLFVARRDAGEVPPRRARIRLGDQLERTVADARQLDPRATIELRGDAPALATHVDADAGRLHQLLMVLLDNALRYSPERRAIRVDVRRSGPQVRVRVRDHGIGIPAEDLPHVFDRFVRGSNALPGGTGLGLPVAKAIAQAHGGTLDIESHQGNGTSVTLTLPASEEGPAA
jgi:signal transduction histidine kinase